MSGELSKLEHAGRIQPRDEASKISLAAENRRMRAVFDRIRDLANPEQRQIWELCLRYGSGAAMLDDREGEKTLEEYEAAAEEGR